MMRREAMRLEGHETVVFPAVYQGLRELFSNYSRLTGQELPTGSALAHYDSLRNSLGAGMVPPRVLLRGLVGDLASISQAAGARDALNLLVTGYGPPPDSASMASEIAAAERAPKPSETVESLLATPFPGPDDAQAYVGEWVGSLWMTADQPRNNNVSLRVRIENSRVIAETRHAGAPPEMAGWIPVDYLRITPVGLTYGRLNGMRPRGVMLWVGTLKGDTLSGKGRWGGVVVDSPPEVDPGFLFVRKRQ
jgi:hypothetical protein